MSHVLLLLLGRRQWAASARVVRVICIAGRAAEASLLALIHGQACGRRGTARRSEGSTVDRRRWGEGGSTGTWSMRRGADGFIVAAGAGRALGTKSAKSLET